MPGPGPRLFISGLLVHLVGPVARPPPPLLDHRLFERLGAPLAVQLLGSPGLGMLAVPLLPRPCPPTPGCGPRLPHPRSCPDSVRHAGHHCNLTFTLPALLRWAFPAPRCEHILVAPIMDARGCGVRVEFLSSLSGTSPSSPFLEGGPGVWCLPSCGSRAPHGSVVSSGGSASPAATLRGCLPFFGRPKYFVFSFGCLWVPVCLL